MQDEELQEDLYAAAKSGDVERLREILSLSNFTSLTYRDKVRTRSFP